MSVLQLTKRQKEGMSLRWRVERIDAGVARFGVKKTFNAKSLDLRVAIVKCINRDKRSDFVDGKKW